MDEYVRRMDALDQVWQQWARIGGGLRDDEWRQPTRCAPWTVHDLYAHHSGFPLAFAAATTPVPADGAPVTAIDVLRGFNDPDGTAHTMAAVVADHAMTEAAAHLPAELVDRFASAGATAVAALRTADPTTVVSWGPYVVALGEAVRIVLMEATVHLLDLERALVREPSVADAALHETVVLLAEVAPAVELIEAATGRAPGVSPLPVIR